jgi:hypothetical protein
VELSEAYYFLVNWGFGGGTALIVGLKGSPFDLVVKTLHIFNNVALLSALLGAPYRVPLEAL